jgi:hypothetical protein
MNKNALSFPEREYKKEKQNPDGSETYWCPVCKNYLEPELFFRHYRKNMESVALVEDAQQV